MKRKIKFRAWNGKRMVRVFHLAWSRGKLDEVNEEMEEMTKRFKLMQFTGLKDKNGKEIFEGDILTGNDEVYFKDGSFMAGADCPLGAFGAEMVEIIGNIYGGVLPEYENPELLKEDIDEKEKER